MILLEDLLTTQTREDVKQSLYNALSDLGLPTTSWKPGAVIRTLISGVAVMFETALRMQNQLARSGFREHIKDRRWAVLVAKNIYGYTPREATYATGKLTITNTKHFVYNYLEPGDIIVQASGLRGKPTYTNTESVNIAPAGAAGDSVEVQFRAVEAGSASSAHPGEVDTLVTSLLGLQIENKTTWTGLDEMDIEEIWQACDDHLDSRSVFGPPGAYRAAARKATLPDGKPVSATRFQVTSAGGVVTMYCGGPNGEVEGSIDDPSTELGAIALAMREWATPAGIEAYPASVTAKDIVIRYRAVFSAKSGIPLEDRRRATDRALREFLSQEPIGGRVVPPHPGKVFVDALEGVIRQATPGCITVQVTVPNADLVLGEHEVVVSTDIQGDLSEVHE